MDDSQRDRDRNRKFYELPVDLRLETHDVNSDRRSPPASSSSNSWSNILGSTESQNSASDTESLFNLISSAEIGQNEKFLTPFGFRRILYCDYTASGRSLSFIEDFIRNEVLPDYGNTHTTLTSTALQTTLFRSEARDIIKNAVNASEHDCLIFCGSGCTGAVHKLINGLNLTEPPVVFVSPYEHHSNLLPWRELMAEVNYANEAPDGSIDLLDLELRLKKYENDKRVKIGSFSAASNITGILSDIDRITILLHKYGFLSFWDFASAAPHIDINMNPYLKSDENKELAYKDAVFISTHKFVGGPQTPGILVCKKKLFKNRVPNGCGGGTVFYVTKKDHRYLKNEEHREEGGTPSIIESIRAGLVFQLKMAIGVANILNRENYFTTKAIHFLTKIPNLHIMGSLNVERLALFSFLIKHEQSGLYLHTNFVTSLLNDLFGIQTRSGCACAGPYAQYLMGMNYELAKAYEEVLIQDERIDRTHLRIRHETTKSEILRPGFTRFNLAFFLDEKRVDFVLRAIKFVCEHGWQFLPFYIFNLETGEFRHRNLQNFKDRKWLSFINYKNGMFNYNRKVFYPKDVQHDLPDSDEQCLEMAYKALEGTKHIVQISDQRLIFNEETARLRWFLLPSEAYGLIHNNKSLFSGPMQPPFHPKTYSINHNLIENLYKIESDPKEAHLKDSTRALSEQASIYSFDEYANAYYSNEDLSHYIKLIRKEISHKIHTLNDPVKFKNNLFNFSHRIKIQDANNNNTNDHPSLEDDHSMRRAVEPISATHENQNSEEKANFISPVRVKKALQLANNNEENVKHEWHNPLKSIFKPFTEALQEFCMIKGGDKVLVCLSGGKDSMSLLHAIRQYKFVAKSRGINFEFGAVTVDPKTPSYNPNSLKAYLAQLNVPYFYEEQTIIETAENLPYECASICSFCSRMKRGRIYSTARKQGYNVLALGQHLDDICESFMMSLFYNGKLWSMKAHYKNEEGDLRIIRPFVYVREKDLRSFAESNKLPIIPENCPACFDAPKERHRMKQLLAQQEVQFPNLFSSLLSAIKPIISIDKTKISIKTLSEYALKLVRDEKSLYEELCSKSRTENFSDEQASSSSVDLGDDLNKD